MHINFSENLAVDKKCIYEHIDSSSLKILFVCFPEIYLWSQKLSLFLEGGGGTGKTTLLLFKDLTLRLGGGVKSDNVTLFDVFFDGVP